MRDVTLKEVWLRRVGRSGARGAGVRPPGNAWASCAGRAGVVGAPPHPACGWLMGAPP